MGRQAITSGTAKKLAPHRGKIAINDDQELKYRIRHLKISRAELQRTL
jgi:hypothetical protein